MALYEGVEEGADMWLYQHPSLGLDDLNGHLQFFHYPSIIFSLLSRRNSCGFCGTIIVVPQ